MPVRMLDDRVLVLPVHNDEINPGGVVYVGVPTTTFVANQDKAEQICTGRVSAVGPGKRHPKTGKRRPPDVMIGEYVAFSDTCHRPVEVNGIEYLVIRESDIAGKSREPIGHVSVNY